MIAFYFTVIFPMYIYDDVIGTNPEPTPKPNLNIYLILPVLSWVTTVQ